MGLRGQCRASLKHLHQNLSLLVLRLLADAVRALVVESRSPEIEREQRRSKDRASAALGSLLNWIATGVPATLSGDHVRAGWSVSRILFVAASGESCCGWAHRRCGRDGFAARATGSFCRLCQDPTAGSGWSASHLRNLSSNR